MSNIPATYVITSEGRILVQLPDPQSQWGFQLHDDDQNWDGGLGIASRWEAIAPDDFRISDADRERLSWILENATA